MTTTGNDPEFRQYRRKAVAEMRDLSDGETVATLTAAGVSISGPDALLAEDEFRRGKVARNRANHADLWYVSPAYFEMNFAPLEPEDEPAASSTEERDQRLHDVRNALAQLPPALAQLRFSIGEDLPFTVSTRAIHRAACLRLEEARLICERHKAAIIAAGGEA